MAKQIFIILLTMIILISFSSCLFKNEKNDGSIATYGDPPPPYVCGFMQKCTNGDKYLTVTYFEILTEYDAADIETDGSGYFAIIGVDTNLSESDFSSSGNSVGIHFINQAISLDFVSFDPEKGEVVYEVPQKTYFDYYSELPKLKLGGHQYSNLQLFMDMDVFAKLCIINGVQYSGKYILLYLVK